MRKDALFLRFEPFVAAAVIGAHANAPVDGFRQREVRFVIELFTNWCSTVLEGEVLDLGNTQVLRYLDGLVAEGFARRSIRKKWPYYRLTRVGLIEMIGRLVNVQLMSVPAHFFFIYYFLTNYRARVAEMIKAEGKQFPTALRLEIEGLLDVKSLVKRQLQFAEKEIKKVEEKIEDAVRGSKYAAKLYADGLTHMEVAAEIERLYPYSLNSQKPLTKLLAEIPEDIGRWELEVGGVKRAEQIFGPTKSALLNYIQQLKRLADLI